jgi:VanZ family protein
MTKILRSLLFVACLGIILFFALKPDPEVPEGMAPSAVIVFFNSFDAFRNQLAFGLFGIAALLLLSGRKIWNRSQLLAVSLIAVLIPVLEIAQLWMPHRFVDLNDVLNGWLGLGVACLLYGAVRWLWQIATRGRSKTGLATRRGGH